MLCELGLMLFICYSKFLQGKVLCSMFHLVLTIFVTLTFTVDEDMTCC